MENRTFSTWGNWSRSSREINIKELPATFDEQRPLKAFMGWDGMFILDHSIDIVDMTREYITHAAVNSCGQCSSCRNGMDRLKTVIDKICDGRGTEADLDQMEYLARFIKDSSKCDIGLTTPLPVLDSIENYREEFLSAIQSQAPVPRGDYVAKVTAPCVNACPSHLDIPNYVEKIRDGRWVEALEIIRKDCCMPGTIGRICVRPCEFNCRRGLMDEPIAIKSLKRFAADQEIAASAEPEAPEIEFKEEKVAIIGAGPAGLSCAYNLGLRGYKTTIFEDMREPGGMAATGIPDYRLPREILRREAEIVQKMGAEIRYNMNVGEDITLEDLTNEGYKAIFVAVGAPESSRMRCEGEDEGYMCFMTGIELLRLVSLGRQPLEGKKLVAIGGGNVAMDCVRTALRIGFEDVNLVYRRTEAEMPADPVEIEEAKEEGVIFHYLIQPIKILAENNKVTGLECLRMELGEPDESGRPRPVPVEGSNFVIEADAIIPAIGQVCIVDCVIPEESEAELTRWKTLVVDEMTFQSGQPNIFGGGDSITGPATLIAALAAGKNAARFIESYLEDKESVPENEDWLEKMIGNLGVYDSREIMPFAGQTRRMALNALEPEIRIQSFDEVEDGVTQGEAAKEADRCLRCYRLGLAAI